MHENVVFTHDFMSFDIKNLFLVVTDYNGLRQYWRCRMSSFASLNKSILANVIKEFEAYIKSLEKMFNKPWRE